MDSLLVNGKGAVNCQSQNTLTSLLNPNLLAILRKSNLTVSDKGYVENVVCLWISNTVLAVHRQTPVL